MNAFIRPGSLRAAARTLDAALLAQCSTLELAEHVPPFRSGEEFAFAPQFFLASVSPHQWVPRVVVVREHGRTLGFLYSKERKLANVPTGVIYVDGTIVSPVYSDAADRADVLRTAVRFLFSSTGVRALRLLIAPRESDIAAVLQAVSSLHMDVASKHMVSCHSRLSLPSRYEQFLARMGNSTRRNFRRYRFRFEVAGGRYAEQLTLDEFTSAASVLATKSHIAVTAESIQRCLRMLAVAPRPLMAGLRGSNGQWVAILGGWKGTQSTMLFSQLNADRDYPHHSLSVVLRGYVIESLIAQGMQEILFWAGSSNPLGRWCSPIPGVFLYLDARTWAWSHFRRAAGRISKWFPKLASAEWITSLQDRT